MAQSETAQLFLRETALAHAVKIGIESGDIDADVIVKDAKKFADFLAEGTVPSDE